jgi:phosphoribosylaminoimidazolecarboxamide formyltransferase/IMP cyclohydrolase
VAGGLLVQELNASLFNPEDLRVATEKAPTEEELEQLKFAWTVVKHTKSNAIVLAKDNMTVGVGPGQTNRITALELAIRYRGTRPGAPSWRRTPISLPRLCGGGA